MRVSQPALDGQLDPGLDFREPFAFAHPELAGLRPNVDQVLFPALGSRDV